MAYFSERRCGLESSSSSAKLVLISRHKTRVWVDEVCIEEESFAARSAGSARPPLEITRQLLSQCKLSGHRTIFVAGEGTASCLVIIPQLGQSDLESALLLQARRSLGWDLAAPIMAHLDSNFLRDRIGSLVGLADWKAVKPWCRLIESRGGMVDDLTVRGCAYEALARWQHWPEHYGVVLIMDIGAASTGFYFLNGPSIKFVREVPIGGDAFTKALMTELSTATGPVRLSGVEAEKMKIKGGSATDEQAPALALKTETSGDRGILSPRVDMMMRPMIERILAETQRSIQFFSENTGQKIMTVMITGGASNVALLRSELQAALSVPVKDIDPFERLQFREQRVKAYAEEHKTQLAVAVGLGLAHQPPLSLLPKVDQIAKNLAVFAFAAVAALLVLGFLPLVGIAIYQTVGIQQTRAELVRTRAQVAQMEASRREFQELQPQVQQVEAQCQFLRSLIVREPLWPGIFNALADAMPENIVLTRCATVPSTKATGAIAITGHVLSSADGFDQAIAALLAALSASPFFSQVTVTMAEAQRTEEVHGAFEIQCELVY